MSTKKFTSLLLLAKDSDEIAKEFSIIVKLIDDLSRSSTALWYWREHEVRLCVLDGFISFISIFPLTVEISGGWSRADVLFFPIEYYINYVFPLIISSVSVILKEKSSRRLHCSSESSEIRSHRLAELIYWQVIEHCFASAISFLILLPWL